MSFFEPDPEPFSLDRAMAGDPDHVTALHQAFEKMEKDLIDAIYAPSPFMKAVMKAQDAEKDKQAIKNAEMVARMTNAGPMGPYQPIGYELVPLPDTSPILRAGDFEVSPRKKRGFFV